MQLLGEEEGSTSQWKWVGFLGVLAGVLILSYYSVIAGWVLVYIVKSVSGAFSGATSTIKSTSEYSESDSESEGNAKDPDAYSEVGLTRPRISSLYLFATTTSAVCLPKVGAVLDRVGPGKMMPIVIAGLAGACAFYARASSEIHILLAFYFLRLTGQGSLWLVSTNLINVWFVEKRPAVMGVINWIHCNTSCMRSSS